MRNVLLFAVLIFILSACKSLQHLPDKHANQDIVEKNKVGFRAIEARMVVSGLDAAKGGRLTVLLHSQKDSLLGANIYALGMKVAALKLLEEKGLFVDYLKKNYIRENAEKLRSQLDLPVQLGLLQTILIADFDLRNYRFSRKTGHYTNRHKDKTNYTVLQLDTARQWVQEAVFFAAGHARLRVSYSGYKQVKQDYIPKYLTVNFEQMGETKEIQLKFTAFEVVPQAAFKLLPPQDFTRMTFQGQ